MVFILTALQISFMTIILWWRMWHYHIQCWTRVTIHTSMLYTFSSYFSFSCWSFWFNMGTVILNVRIFSFNPGGHHWSKSLSENIWLPKIGCCWINRYIHILFSCGESVSVVIIKRFGHISVKTSHCVVFDNHAI